MDIVGFCRIKKTATTCNGALDPNEFIGQICPVYEVGHDDCVLVINPKGTALDMFDKEDVQQSFKCAYRDGIVMPPGLDFFDQMAYMMRVRERKGGYNKLLCNMVIVASLMKGEFNDDFLWQKQ